MFSLNDFGIQYKVSRLAALRKVPYVVNVNRMRHLVIFNLHRLLI